MKKIALITGGNSGIGFATAQKLQKKGYQVYIVGRNPEKVQQAASKLGVEPLIADMGQLVDIESLAALFRNSGLDVLVNNAGIAQPVPIEAYDGDVFDRLFYTNVRGPLFLIKNLLSAIEKKSGSITTVSSIITQRGASGFSLYAATKGAVNAFTKNLAVELAPRGVRVNAVCPGAIETPIFSKMGIPSEQLGAAKEQLLSTIPLRRFGSSEEVANVILAQLEATYVTGSVWEIDGGVNT